MRAKEIIRAGLAALTMTLLGILAGPAPAAIVFTPGNNPQPDEENILFGDKETGALLTGQTKGSLVPVYFSSLTSQTLNQAAKGQADIQKDGGGLLDSLRITTVPDSGTAYGFGDFIMNLQGGSSGSQASIDVFYHDDFNNTDTSTNYTFPTSGDLGNGSNFLTIVANNGDYMTKIEITMITGGWSDFKQPRISGVCEIGSTGCGLVPVPEPASLALVASAAAFTGWFARRRRNS